MKIQHLAFAGDWVTAKTMSESQIVNAFLCPEFYDHPVEHIELIETHISWVFLTGRFAYKLKKPVNFGFLNFSSLELRKYYCHQELALNSRFAPQIYLDVLSVSEQHGKLRLAGQGTIVDYVIKMQQFDHNSLLEKLAKNHRLKLEHIDNLIDIVADFHDQIAIAGSDTDFGSVQQVIKPVEENFSILKSILADCPVDKQQQQLLDTLHGQMLSMYESIRAYLLSRKKQGHIRECHGDLHLGNITLIDNKVQLFDGIEFNDSFRWIDTISDCAFLIMDLQDHGQMLFAQHFLNGYLIKSGDYSGLFLLRFYKFYRAMVRAKVAALKLPQQSTGTDAYENTEKELTSYLNLADSYASDDRKASRRFLAINFGLSGSGKSWVSSRLADQLEAIQLRSDVERKRLLTENVPQLYSDSATEQIYTHLYITCKTVLDAGYAVIVDATFLDKKRRLKFCKLAEQYQIPFYILSCHANQKTIRQRLQLRETEANNVSDADISVMEKQLLKMDALDSDEKTYEIDIDTDKTLDFSLIANQILNNKG